METKLTMFPLLSLSLEGTKLIKARLLSGGYSLISSSLPLWHLSMCVCAHMPLFVLMCIAYHFVKSSVTEPIWLFYFIFYTLAEISWSQTIWFNPKSKTNICLHSWIPTCTVSPKSTEPQNIPLIKWSIFIQFSPKLLNNTGLYMWKCSDSDRVSCVSVT